MHKGGGLRQVVINNGELALTRMTPISDNEDDPVQISEDVHQEFKATMSYLSRFGFNADDGLDVIFISDSQTGEMLGNMIETPCNYHHINAQEAADYLKIPLGYQQDPKYADVLHVAWAGGKSKFILPLKAKEIDKVSQPRQIATLVSVLLVLGAGYQAYDLMNKFDDLNQNWEQIEEYENRRSTLQLRYNQEVKRKQDMGFDIQLIQSSLTIHDKLEKRQVNILDLVQKSRQESESQAIFADVDWRISDALTVNFGGRYTKDDKETVQTGMVNASNDETWNEFTPRVGVRYEFSDNIMAYATYSTGYRAGGFNGRVNSVEEAIQPYDPETVDNIEVGFKSEWMDSRVRFNASYFVMNYDDKQEELQLPSDTGTGQKTVVTNASEATIQGLELEVQALIGEGFSLRANIGFLDTEYDNFQYTDAVSLETVDLSYLEFRRAPDVTATVDGTYEWDTSTGRAWLRASYHFLGSHWVNVTNSPELRNEGQGLLDASVNWEFNDWQFSFFGRNLTDEDGYTHGYDVAGLWSYSAVRPPRTYGLEAIYRFGD